MSPLWSPVGAACIRNPEARVMSCNRFFQNPSYSHQLNSTVSPRAGMLTFARPASFLPAASFSDWFNISMDKEGIFSSASYQTYECSQAARIYLVWPGHESLAWDQNPYRRVIYKPRSFNTMSTSTPQSAYPFAVRCTPSYVRSS